MTAKQIVGIVLLELGMWTICAIIHYNVGYDDGMKDGEVIGELTAEKHEEDQYDR